jgi:hypothetical protein
MYVPGNNLKKSDVLWTSEFSTKYSLLVRIMSS